MEALSSACPQDGAILSLEVHPGAHVNGSTFEVEAHTAPFSAPQCQRIVMYSQFYEKDTSFPFS